VIVAVVMRLIVIVLVSVFLFVRHFLVLILILVSASSAPPLCKFRIIHHRDAEFAEPEYVLLLPNAYCLNL